MVSRFFSQLVSEKHCIVLEDALIPAGCLRADQPPVRRQTHQQDTTPAMVRIDVNPSGESLVNSLSSDASDMSTVWRQRPRIRNRRVVLEAKPAICPTDGSPTRTAAASPPCSESDFNPSLIEMLDQFLVSDDSARRATGCPSASRDPQSFPAG